MAGDRDTPTFINCRPRRLARRLGELGVVGFQLLFVDDKTPPLPANLCCINAMNGPYDQGRNNQCTSHTSRSWLLRTTALPAQEVAPGGEHRRLRQSGQEMPSLSSFRPAISYTLAPFEAIFHCSKMFFEAPLDTPSSNDPRQKVLDALARRR